MHVHHFFPNFFSLYSYLCTFQYILSKCIQLQLKIGMPRQKQHSTGEKTMDLKVELMDSYASSTNYWMSGLGHITFLSLNFIWNKGLRNETIYIKVFDRVQAFNCMQNEWQERKEENQAILGHYGGRILIFLGWQKVVEVWHKGSLQLQEQMGTVLMRKAMDTLLI